MLLQLHYCRYVLKIHRLEAHYLQSTRVDHGGALLELDGAGAGTSGLKSLNNIQGLLVGDLTEDDVAAIQPGGNDGGDEELGAVAAP